MRKAHSAVPARRTFIDAFWRAPRLIFFLFREKPLLSIPVVSSGLGWVAAAAAVGLDVPAPTAGPVPARLGVAEAVLLAGVAAPREVVDVGAPANSVCIAPGSIIGPPRELFLAPPLLAPPPPSLPAAPAAPPGSALASLLDGAEAGAGGGVASSSMICRSMSRRAVRFAARASAAGEGAGGGAGAGAGVASGSLVGVGAGFGWGFGFFSRSTRHSAKMRERIFGAACAFIVRWRRCFDKSAQSAAITFVSTREREAVERAGSGGRSAVVSAATIIKTSRAKQGKGGRAHTGGLCPPVSVLVFTNRFEGRRHCVGLKVEASRQQVWERGDTNSERTTKRARQGQMRARLFGECCREMSAETHTSCSHAVAPTKSVARDCPISPDELSRPPIRLIAPRDNRCTCRRCPFMLPIHAASDGHRGVRGVRGICTRPHRIAYRPHSPRRAS